MDKAENKQIGLKGLKSNSSSVVNLSQAMVTSFCIIATVFYICPIHSLYRAEAKASSLKCNSFIFHDSLSHGSGTYGQSPVLWNKDLMENNYDYVLWWLSFQSQFWADTNVWLKMPKISITWPFIERQNNSPRKFRYLNKGLRSSTPV